MNSPTTNCGRPSPWAPSSLWRPSTSGATSSDNQITNFDEEFLADNGKLAYLNLRGNKLEKLEEIRKLNVFATLKTLVVTGNPAVEKVQDHCALEILPSFRGLDRLNKTPVTPDLLETLWNWERSRWELEVQRQKEKELEQQAKENAERDE